MRWMMMGVGCGLLACTGTASVTDATGDTAELSADCSDGPARVQIRLPSGTYAQEDVGQLPYGTPPQGGAPYTPVEIRARGMDGALQVMAGVGAGGAEPLGGTEVLQRMICSNTGDSAGWWVGSEVHLRYPGVALDDLQDLAVELWVDVEDGEGRTGRATLVGTLDRTL